MSDPTYRVWAEISAAAVKHNLAAIRKRVGDTKVMAVLKANAYGHGAVEMARLVEADSIGVGDSGEAIELRDAGIEKPILIVGAVIPGEMAAVIERKIEVNLHNVRMAEELNAEALTLGVKVRVHLKIDTGMGRLGMQPFEAVPFLHTLRALSQLELVGLCTHLSYPNERDQAFTTRQLERFNLAVEVADRLGYGDLTLHTSSSLAVFGREDACFNMVRTGMALWGHLPGEVHEFSRLLTPALELKTRVLYLKDVPEGTPIGYRRTYYTQAPARIATLPVGYNDGYRASLANRAEVLLRGVRCPVVGAVSMDYLTVDVSAAGEVEPGDVVTLIGRDGDDAIALTELAAWADSHPYEILCGLGRRVARVY